MSGTATALGTALLGAGLLTGVLAVGHASATAARASGAADLAALAASDARRGLGADPDAGVLEPCPLAEESARRNGAEVTECVFQPDGSVRVAVVIAADPLPASTAVAVAGPPMGPRGLVAGPGRDDAPEDAPDTPGAPPEAATP